MPAHAGTQRAHRDRALRGLQLRRIGTQSVGGDWRREAGATTCIYVPYDRRITTRKHNPGPLRKTAMRAPQAAWSAACRMPLARLARLRYGKCVESLSERESRARGNRRRWDDDHVRWFRAVRHS